MFKPKMISTFYTLLTMAGLVASVNGASVVKSRRGTRPDYMKPSAFALSSETQSWSDITSALAASPQVWTNYTRPNELGERSSWQFDIGCIGTGAVQPIAFGSDIYGAVHNWFAGSDTGSTCADNEEYLVGCSGSTDACTYDGSFASWNSGIMDCYAFVALEAAVVSSCADPGWGDCGCGVYYDYGTGKCLVGTYTYHVSGPGTENIAYDDPQVPAPVSVSVNHARDSLGPNYTDLQVCEYYAYGDIEEWCEGSATHVC